MDGIVERSAVVDSYYVPRMRQKKAECSALRGIISP